jgi:eukaryotic-like serine/threonine-protein kinase
MAHSSNKPSKTPCESDLSGRQLGNFGLLRRIGKGAMADVYLAEQLLLKRRVAVKILKPALANDKTYLKRFEREAQAAASLIHANIVQIHEVGHVDEIHYMAQEYVEGQNLREWIARHGPPDLPHALSIMRQVAAALTKAAEQGVVHRDIKPENIMLTRAGEVKVTDFGLARVVREEDASDLTQVGITMGTPLYMSPEQVEGKLLDHRSDVYSFGVTCYHMLTGSPPFCSETALGVAVQHLKKEPPELEALRPDLPAPLCRIVHKMLAKGPEQRYQSAREVLRELRRVQVEYCGDQWPEDLPGWDLGGIELPEDPRIQATQHLATLMKTIAIERQGRRNGLRWAAALAAVFVAGGLLAWVTRADAPLLLPASHERVAIPRQNTALRQWYYASQLGTKEAWQSVIDYFPDNKYLAHRAEEQLALIYLSRDDDYGAAKLLFDKLANESDNDLRAFGMAGQCGVLVRQRKYDEAAALLGQLYPLKTDLHNRAMQEMLGHIVRKLGLQTTQQWRQWLEEQFPEGS